MLGRGDDADHCISDLHHLPPADLAGLAQLDRAVDRHRAARDDRLAHAAAIADAGELEQVMQLDVIALEWEFDGHVFTVAVHGLQHVDSVVMG